MILYSLDINLLILNSHEKCSWYWHFRSYFIFLTCANTFPGFSFNSNKIPDFLWHRPAKALINNRSLLLSWVWLCSTGSEGVSVDSFLPRPQSCSPLGLDYYRAMYQFSVGNSEETQLRGRLWKDQQSLSPQTLLLWASFLKGKTGVTNDFCLPAVTRNLDTFDTFQFQPQSGHLVVSEAVFSFD